MFYFSLYIAVFIQPATWAFYTASVFIGIAAAGKHCSYPAYCSLLYLNIPVKHFYYLSNIFHLFQSCGQHREIA